MIGKIQDVVTAAVVISAADNGAQISRSTDSGQDAQAVAEQAGANTAILAKSESQAVSTGQAAEQQVNAQDDTQKKEDKMDEKSVSNMTKELNKLMSQINCNLEFQYHKEINMMSVKMIDKDTKEVLKEYPPEDMIKGMIAAREWIGAFLDKTV